MRMTQDWSVWRTSSRGRPSAHMMMIDGKDVIFKKKVASIFEEGHLRS